MYVVGRCDIPLENGRELFTSDGEMDIRATEKSFFFYRILELWS